MPAANASDAHACCYWLTGLSGAGKSTLAHHLSVALNQHGVRTMVLDGDRFRAGLNRDLGFSRADRGENVRRIAEVAKLLVDEGVTVFVSAIAPYRLDRQQARERVGPQRFFEVHVATDLATCAARDTKALYARAARGEIAHLTGWDDPYEAPQRPDFLIHTHASSIAQSAAPLLEHRLGHQRLARMA